MNMLPNIRTLETVARELKAVATAALALPLRPLLPSDAFDPDAPHPIPVVLVHGLCGDPTNFLRLKRTLRSGGISNFATFAYRPQFAYQRLIARLTETIERWLADADPGATLVPIAMPGFSDSHWFRRAFDSAIVRGPAPYITIGIPCSP